MNRLTLAAVLLIAMSNVWAGGGPTGGYTTLGVRSCGTYIQDRQAHGVGYVIEQGWVGGYISAYNRLMPDTVNILGGTDLDSVMLWLANYCNAHPLEDLADAMVALTNERFPHRFRTPKDAGH